MPTSLKQAFGGGAASRADGLPPLPNAAGVPDVTSNTRHCVIEGSTDTIRVPFDNSSPALYTLGYRRIDRFEGGGASEWIIDWNAVSSFTGWTLSDLDDAVWGSFQIKGNIIYIGFNAFINDVGVDDKSYLMAANLTTGAITSVTGLSATPTLILSTTVDNTFKGDSSTCNFWEVLDDGKVLCYYNTSTSSYTIKGTTKVVYSSDLTLVDSEVTYFDTDLTTSPDSLSISYASEDGEILVVKPDSNITTILLPTSGHIITLSNSSVSTLLGSGDFIHRLADVGGGATTVYNCLTDDVVGVGRRFENNSNIISSNGNRGIARPFVKRVDLDNYLRQLVFNFSGVIV